MSLPRLIAITPAVGEDDLPRLSQRIRAAAEAGLSAIVLRLPDVADGAYLQFAREVRAALGGGWLALHDRPHLVRASRADAVHLGHRSLTPSEARRVVGRGVSLGFSSHAGDAVPEEADYVTHSPVRPTSKDGRAVEPVGVDGLAQFCARTDVPVLALGGLGPEDVRDCLRAGARGVAAIGALLGAPDPAGATRAFKSALECVGARP